MIATAAILFTAWWALPPWIKEIPAGLFVSYFLRRKNRNEEYVKGRKSYNRCCKLLQRGKDLALRSEENAPKAGTLLCLIRRYLVILDEIWESVTEKGCKKPGFLEVFAFFALMRQLKDTRANERDRRYQEDLIHDEDPNPILTGLVEPCQFTKLAYKEDGKFIRRKLKKYGFELLSFEMHDLPGTTSYFIAVHHQRRQAYIAVKGTNRLSDFLTNFCARSLPCNLKGPFVEGGDHSFFAHEGMALVSRTLVDEIEPIVENFLLPGGYKTSVVGHSLGGSVACGIGMLLRSRLGVRYPHILRDNGDIINVVACAPAPYVDIKAARQCSSFITCVVNNSDLVVRASTQNTIMGMHFLKTVRRSLEETDSWPRGVPSLIRFARALWSSEPFMTMVEVKRGMRLAHGAALGDGVDNLYVPGKVLHMYDLWDATNGRKGKQIVMTDGMSTALQMLEFDDRCQFVKDHMIGPYVREIQQLAAGGSEKKAMKKDDHLEVIKGTHEIPESTTTRTSSLPSELNVIAAISKRKSGIFLGRVGSCIGTC